MLVLKIQSNIDKPSNSQAATRNILYELTNTNRMRDFQTYSATDDATVECLDRRIGESQYQLFLGDKYRTHPWNKGLVADIVALLRSRGKMPSDVTDAAVAACLWQKIQAARIQWSKGQAHYIDDKLRLETKEEADERVSLGNDVEDLGKRLASRKAKVSGQCKYFAADSTWSQLCSWVPPEIQAEKPRD